MQSLLFSLLENVKNNFTATVNPSVSDDALAGYSPGSQWYNTSAGRLYILASNAAGAANWISINGENYKGAWNASTNTPTLADGAGVNGDNYLVSVAGTQNLGSGAIIFTVGDLVIYNGTIWQKIEGGVAYVPEDVANKDTDGTLAANSDTKYASQKATKTYADTGLALKVNLAGTAGGQTVKGGTAASEALLLQSTAHATKGKVALGSVTTGLVYDEVNNRMSIGSDENTITIAGVSYGMTNSVHAEGATDLAEDAVHRHSDTAGLGAHKVFARSRGTDAAETVVQSGDYLGRIDFVGHDGTDYAIGAQIDAIVDGTPGAGDMPTRLDFLVSPDGSETPALALRIASTGFVGIGKTSPVDTLSIGRITPATSGSAKYLQITPAADTGLTLSTEVPVFSVAGATRTWATGALTTQRDVLLNQPTYAFAGASAITVAATLGIAGPAIGGTNATIASSAGLLISAGAATANTSLAYGAIIYTPTSGSAITYPLALATVGTNGRGLGIGTLGPTATCHITRDSVAPGGTVPYLYIGPVADINLAATAEVPVSRFGSATRTWATGAISIQREAKFDQPAYAFNGASTITNAATIGVVAAPTAATNATITNTHGILVNSASVTATNSYGLTVNAQTGATTNTAAQFIGAAGSPIINQNNASASAYTSLINTVNTTDATVTTIHTITLATDTTYTIKGMVRGRRTGGASGAAGDSAGYTFFATVKNISGTASLVSTADVTAKEDQAGWDLTIDATGATIRIRVTGAASNNITWDLFLEQFGR